MASKLVSTGGSGLNKYLKMIEGLSKNSVTVGVHKSAGGHDDSDLTIAEVATYNEFGATIKNKGGVSYGYATRRDAIKGKSRFMAKGTGYMVIGETGPGVINIPERSFIRSTMKENNIEYVLNIAKIVRKISDGNGGNYKQAMGKLGLRIQNDIQRKIVTLKSPPNAKSTIRKKGSSNPLIDTGQLLSSIRWEYAKND